MALKRKIYKKEDFRKGDFILYQCTKDDYVKGEIVELKDKTVIIEIAIPTKKTEELETEQFEVEYYEIIPFACAVSNFNN